MGVFNIIWGSIPVVVLLSMYFNCRYMIKGDKNILIGVTIPFLELKNEKVLDIVKEFKKENIKGAPTKQWFYFLKKNFGYMAAVKGTLSPYIRILFGK